MEVRVEKTENKVKKFFKDNKAEISAIVGGVTISIATFVYIFNKKWNKIVDSNVCVGEKRGNLSLRINNLNKYDKIVNSFTLTAKSKKEALEFVECIEEVCKELYG